MKKIQKINEQIRQHESKADLAEEKKEEQPSDKKFNAIY